LSPDGRARTLDACKVPLPSCFSGRPAHGPELNVDARSPATPAVRLPGPVDVARTVQNPHEVDAIAQRQLVDDLACERQASEIGGEPDPSSAASPAC
jgi:hypothetical protein